MVDKASRGKTNVKKCKTYVILIKLTHLYFIFVRL